MVAEPSLTRSASPGRDEPLPLQTTAGAIVLRPERTEDTDFLFTVFRSHKLPELAAMPIDGATREALVRSQFQAQAMSYRAWFPLARFDIVEHDGLPIGRIVIDPGGDTACIVDFALLPAHQGRGLGSAILAAVLQHLAPLRRPVRCKVLVHNEPSIRMCRRVGFRHIGGGPPFLQLEWQPAAA